MYIIPVQNLACPIDGELLNLHDNQLVCASGHSFDIARQGYANLLPVQFKRSKHPGDSKEMVLARAQFLHSGCYAPIAEELASRCTKLIAANSRQSCVLDAGCGEGYYLQEILSSVEQYESVNQAAFIGLDISKPAIIEASKRNKRINWIVGTNRQPPLTADSVDIIVCVFGFPCVDAFHNILKLNGKLILVEANSEHLKELREIIYTDLKETQADSTLPLSEHGFVLEEQRDLSFTTGALNNEQINNLMLMTPHFFRTSEAARERVSKLSTLDLSVDIRIRVFNKTKTESM